MIRVLSDALATPQLDSDLKIGVAHGADGQKVRKNGQHHVVSVSTESIRDVSEDLRRDSVPQHCY